MTQGAEMIAEGFRLVTAASGKGATFRLLGGIAVAMHCASVHAVEAYRSFEDLDAITRRRDVPKLHVVLRELGYEPNARFNALNGRDRQIFYGPQGKLDLFVQSFQMCHTIALSGRLELDSPTITVSDLLLTKLQVVQLNQKDVQDAALLLRHHELGEAEGDCLNTAYLSSVLGADWGLWRTISSNLGRVGELEADVRPKVAELLQRFEDQPKTLGFRARAVMGEKKRWYDLPEEVR